MNQIELANYYRRHPEELYGVEIELPPYEEWGRLPLSEELKKNTTR